MPDNKKTTYEQAPGLSLLSRLVFWLWLGYWAFLFTMMHLPKPPGISLVNRLGDKLVHSGVYLVLAMLGGWATLRRGGRLDLRWAIRWGLIYAVYAAADELLQPYVGRACQLGDWVADVIGAWLAIILLTWLGRPGNQGPPSFPKGSPLE